MPRRRPRRAHVGGREAPQKKLGPTTTWEYKAQGDVLIRWRRVVGSMCTILSQSPLIGNHYPVSRLSSRNYMLFSPFLFLVLRLLALFLMVFGWAYLLIIACTYLLLGFFKILVPLRI